MSTSFLFHLFADCCLLFVFGALLPRRDPASLVGGLLGALLAGAATIVIAATVLGYLGHLVFWKIQCVVYAGLVVLWLSRREAARSRFEAWRRLVVQTRGKISRLPSLDKVILSVTCALVLFLSLTALFSSPAVQDTLAYRMPRIALWLQQESLYHFETIDERQNWMSSVPAILMLWVVSHSGSGFPAIQMVQAFGGIVTVLAIFHFGSILGLTKRTRLLAGLLFLLLPNVFVQFMSSQTDLVTTGFLFSGIVFFVESFRSKKFVWQAPLALALAFGSKGTVFYWVPGLAVLFALLWYRYRPSRGVLVRTALAGGVLLLVLVAPRHIENHLRYGNPFADKHSLEAHHRELTLSEHLASGTGNILSYFTQLFEPHSNGFPLDFATKAAGEFLLDSLPGDEVLGQASREAEWRRAFASSRPDVDALSFGWMSVLLAACAVPVAVARTRSTGPSKGASADLLICLLAAMTFFFFLCFRQVGHVFVYRYLVTMAPFLALFAALFFSIRMPRYLKMAGAFLVAVSLGNAAVIWGSARQVGYANIFDPSANGPSVVRIHTTWLMSRIPEDPNGTVKLLLFWNYPAGGFFRVIPNKVELLAEPAGAWSSDGSGRWLVAVAPYLQEGMEGSALAHFDLSTRGGADYSCHLFRLAEPPEVRNPADRDLSEEAGGLHPAAP